MTDEDLGQGGQEISGLKLQSDMLTAPPTGGPSVGQPERVGSANDESDNDKVIGGFDADRLDAELLELLAESRTR
jgi:hypothetical protein